MDKSTLYNSLLEQLDQLDIIDTHEHLSPYEPSYDPSIYPPRGLDCGVISEQEILNENTNVLDNMILVNYIHNQIHASGMQVNWPPAGSSIIEKWDAFEPVWRQIEFTGYGQVSKIAVQDLGFDEINRGNIEKINDAYLATLKPGYWTTYLKDKARIRTSIMDSDLYYDPNFISPAYRLDHFIMPVLQAHLDPMQAFTGVKVRCFDDWLECTEVALDKAIASGAVAIKSGLAYLRTLRFERVTYKEAEESFNQWYPMRFTPGWEANRHMTSPQFQDYMMHHVCRLLEKRNMPIQFHTGLTVGGAGNYIQHANPANLSNLCIEYPDLRFDLFHIGYPYQHELGALAEQSRNVYVDMCWAHMISPKIAQNTLSEWLELLPVNKIMGFGGDLGGGNAHGVNAHAQLARRNVAKVLAEKVTEGLFTETRAVEIAKQLFYDNPAELFNLKGI